MLMSPLLQSHCGQRARTAGGGIVQTLLSHWGGGSALQRYSHIPCPAQLLSVENPLWVQKELGKAEVLPLLGLLSRQRFAAGSALQRDRQALNALISFLLSSLSLLGVLPACRAAGCAHRLFRVRNPLPLPQYKTGTNSMPGAQPQRSTELLTRTLVPSLPWRILHTPVTLLHYCITTSYLLRAPNTPQTPVFCTSFCLWLLHGVL